MVKDGQMMVYRDCTPVADAWYDTGGDESLVGALSRVLATASGMAETELTPLYERIDTDALRQLFETHSGARTANAIIGFEVDQWNVFIRADGRIRVCDGTRKTEPAPVFDGEPA